MSRFGRGDRIADRFVIEGRLASGGMAEIYLAEMELARGVRRRAALKRIHPHLVDDAQFVTMFLDEARVSSQLRHPGVVPVHDAIEHDGELMLVMDYVPGWDLSAVLKHAEREGRPFPLGVVLSIGRGLAETLSYVHSATDMDGKPLEVVHRDVSPSNVLVAEDGTTRLLDFGVAKAASRATRTATATLKGKLAYAAPEQVLGRGVSSKTDIYAVGLVLFELITGKRAIDGKDDFACLELARDPKHVPPSTYCPGLPPELDDLVLWLLAKNPEDRPDDAAVIAERLDALAATTNAATPEAATTEAVRMFVLEVMHSTSRPLEKKRRHLEAALAAIAGGGPTTDVAPKTGVLKPRPRQDSAPPPVDTGVAKALPPPSTPPPAEAIPAVLRPSRLPWAAFFVLLLGGGATGVWFLANSGEADEDPDEVVVADAAQGFLRVTTDPDGAEVFVDGEPWEERTPTIVTSPQGQERLLEVRLADHEPESLVVTARAGETMPVRLALSRTPGRLVVRSRPAGATVAVDGEERGETPLTLSDLPRQSVAVRVEVDGHAPHREDAPLDAQSEHVIDVTLRQRTQVGILNVSSQPWAQVRVDGRLVAESTPATGIRLPAGPHRVTLTNPQLQITKSRRVTIRAGETTPLVVRLR